MSTARVKRVILEVPHRRRSTARAIAENVVKLHGYLKAFVAEADVKAQEYVIASIEAEAESGAGLQIFQVELRLAIEHLARIPEDRHVEAAEDFPSVFGV